MSSFATHFDNDSLKVAVLLLQADPEEAYRLHGDIAGWDVSNVTDMSGMFCSTTFNQDLKDWDVSNVTAMRCMFNGASAFNGDITKWDTTNLRNGKVEIDQIIRKCRAGKNLKILQKHTLDTVVALRVQKRFRSRTFRRIQPGSHHTLSSLYALPSKELYAMVDGHPSKQDFTVNNVE